jgi:U3 small nucleolar RNA-associated protein 23
MVTQCTLAKIMRDHAKSGVKTPRPEFLPPPTEVQLRYCKHEEKGEGWGEVECLLDLIGGMPNGNQMKKNKWHYVLATADPSDQKKRSRGHIDIRERARTIPGVPIVYVKRSVMVLEEFSGASLVFRKGLEKDKFREGLVGGRKRKREDGDADSDKEDMIDPLRVDKGMMISKRGMQRAKGPNPLSVQKKKARVVEQGIGSKDKEEVSGDRDESAPKQKRKRKHAGKKATNNEADGVTGGVKHVMDEHSRPHEAVA